MAYITKVGIRDFRCIESLSTTVGANWIVMGANGSGKTSVLYALILMIQCCNARAKGSSHKEKPQLVVDGKVISQLLNYPPFLNAPLSGFIRKGKDTAQIDSIICGQEFKCSIQANGVMTFGEWPKDFELPDKIRFAFASAEVLIDVAAETRASTDMLTTSAENRRLLFKNLSDENKELIRTHMDELFGITAITQLADYSVMLFETNDKEGSELFFAGAALRKVFCTLVLMYTLAQTTEQKRVMFIEEPEAQLYSTLQIVYFRILQSISQAHKIQLIMTSNTKHVLEQFSEKVFIIFLCSPDKNIFVLHQKGRGNHLDRKDWLQKILETQLLALTSKPIILCEGPEDVKFLATLARLRRRDLSHVQVYPILPSFANHSTLKQFIDTARQLQPDVKKIFVIRDPDFCQDIDAKLQNDNEALKNTATTIYWKLPSIESYLCLFHCLTGKSDFKFLVDPKNQTHLLIQFYNSWKQQNQVSNQTKKIANAIKYSKSNQKLPDEPDPLMPMYEMWNTAINHVTSTRGVITNFEQCIQVAKVLRGHNWVNHVTDDADQLFAELDERIFEWFPELAEVMKQLLG